mgnify:FL=1
MIAILISPLYILINIYIVKWLIKWTETCSKIFKNKIIKYIVIITYIFFASSFITGFFLPYKKIKIIGNYFLGVIQYIILIVVLADLIRILLKKTKIVNEKILSSKITFIISGFICILLTILLSTYGVIHSKKIVYTDYNVNIDKVSNIDNLKISLVSDIHLGYNTHLSHIKKMVDMINNSNSDLVLIAGDIFDNNYEAIGNDEDIINELKRIKSKYGVYAVYGNHDIDEKILAGFTFNWDKSEVLIDPRMEEFLSKSNIKTLRDETILIDDSFYLIGRLDYHKYGIKINERKTIEELTKDIDIDKPIIVLDHEPYELNELSNNNVDLDLSGHTHNGQMFPSNILLKVIWDNPYGLLKVGNMTSIVTSGIGVYGPNMRVLSTAEVVNINVNFKTK